MNTSDQQFKSFIRENHQYNLKRGVEVPVELKMAPGLKVGNRVKAKATSLFGGRRAGDIFGPWACHENFCPPEIF